MEGEGTQIEDRRKADKRRKHTLGENGELECGWAAGQACAEAAVDGRHQPLISWCRALASCAVLRGAVRCGAVLVGRGAWRTCGACPVAMRVAHADIHDSGGLHGRAAGCSWVVERRFCTPPRVVPGQEAAELGSARRLQGRGEGRARQQSATARQGHALARRAGGVSAGAARLHGDLTAAEGCRSMRG